MCDDPHEGLEYALRGQDLARQLGMRYGLGISVLNAVPCACSGPGSGTAPHDRGRRAVEDDDLGDFADAGRAAAVVRALRGDGTGARRPAGGRGRRRGPPGPGVPRLHPGRGVRGRGRRSLRPSATPGAPPRSSRPRRWTPSSSPGRSPSARRTSWATARLSTICSRCSTVATTARSRCWCAAERRLDRQPGSCADAEERVAAIEDAVTELRAVGLAVPPGARPARPRGGPAARAARTRRTWSPRRPRSAPCWALRRSVSRAERLAERLA